MSDQTYGSAAFEARQADALSACGQAQDPSQAKASNRGQAQAQANPFWDHFLSRVGTDESQAAKDMGMDFAAAATYLKDEGFADNYLTQARKNKNEARKYADFDAGDERVCDFCGRVLSGAEFDVLKDGRERCVECSETVVDSQEDFEALFAQTSNGMALKLSIKIPSHIIVSVVSQRKLARVSQSRFVPTSGFDPRALGVAVLKRNGDMFVLLENGAPRMALAATLAHELTHIWQYSNWDLHALKQRYGAAYVAVCEGMAQWAQIQYLFLVNEPDYAERVLDEEASRKDVYGYGLRLFLNRYPLSRGIIAPSDTPFRHLENPIDLP